MTNTCTEVACPIRQLSRCPLFSGLSDEECRRAAALLRVVRRDYRRGESLHRAGEPFTHFGLVLSGTVHVCRLDVHGEEALMAAVSPGETFGESLAYLAVENAPVYIHTPDGATVLWMEAAPLRRAHAAPDPLTACLCDRFTAMLAARTLDMNERIQILSKLTLREKLMTFLLSYARRAGSKTLSIPFSRASLAVYLGVNRTALSRELSRMQRDGLIDYYRDSFRILW